MTLTLIIMALILFFACRGSRSLRYFIIGAAVIWLIIAAWPILVNLLGIALLLFIIIIFIKSLGG
jgi:hypothetical protein